LKQKAARIGEDKGTWEGGSWGGLTKKKIKERRGQRYNEGMYHNWLNEGERGCKLVVGKKHVGVWPENED